MPASRSIFLTAPRFRLCSAAAAIARRQPRDNSQHKTRAMEPAASGKRRRDEGMPLSHEPFTRPLEFVNRYMETLDVLIPNFRNQEALRRKGEVRGKMYTPLAAQPPGTGKTALGTHLISVLRRPRESPALEEEVSRRLMHAWAWGATENLARRTIESAMTDERNECLVMRTLRVCFPLHEGTLARLKESKPVVVVMKDLLRPGVGIVTALIRELLCWCCHGAHPRARPSAFCAGRHHRPTTARVLSVF